MGKKIRLKKIFDKRLGDAFCECALVFVLNQWGCVVGASKKAFWRPIERYQNGDQIVILLTSGKTYEVLCTGLKKYDGPKTFKFRSHAKAGDKFTELFNHIIEHQELDS